MKATLLYPIAVHHTSLLIIRNTLVHVLTFEDLSLSKGPDQGLEVWRICKGSQTRIIVLTDFSEVMRRVNQSFRPAVQLYGPEVPLPQSTEVPDALVEYTWNTDPRPHGEILSTTPDGLTKDLLPYQIVATDIFGAWNDLFSRLLTPS